ncbi:MAG: helix-turn-helix domain-containing protein [Methanocorpusculum sp.]|nr:helix-turn-helix domain-containing protein [Methanocorpusculum sp.]
MVKVPCQDIVMNIIPAIQASLAAELVNLGISQVQAARALSVAPSAVSQYLSGKRGYRIVFNDEINEIIRDLAKEIQSGKLDENDLEKKFCELCGILRGEAGCSLSCKE